MNRIVECLKYGWQFSRGEIPKAADFDCRFKNWQTVRVPHDYAIEGPFDPQNDKGNLMATADGFPATLDSAGRTGALPLAGTAWYRRELFIAQEWEGRRITLEFDGIMSHSEIFVNGTLLHQNVYGYTSFCVDITDAVKYGTSNLVAVRVSQYPWESRWYPGAGIYRNVRLVVKAPSAIAYNGVYITSANVSEQSADVVIHADVIASKAGLKLEAVLLDACGEAVACGSASVDNNAASLSLHVTSPRLWSHTDPYLYTAVLTLKDDTGALDTQEIRVGIRSIEIDEKRGFFVNGVYTKLKGVCMHHDMGAIGAAVNVSALRRQFRILADMGCNAIRTSHNPPAPELLELADELGFYVIDEFFDQWRVKKTTNGYSMYFDTCAESDLTATIRRDRSHPSVIMWSIGNEVGDQSLQEGGQTAQFLAELCRREDPTRPVTCGFDNEEGAFANGLTQAVDVVGLNYRQHTYKSCYERFGRPLYGSETASCVSSRGVYYIPRKQALIFDEDPAKQIPDDRGRRSYRYYDYVEIPAPVRSETEVSSYDLSAPNWAYYPEVEFAAQDDYPELLGEFVWTGFDYLGEPTPFGMYAKGGKLARSSYFGIVDLAGIPKDRFWSYQAKWSDRNVLHLFPHWNWNVGDVLPVCCYSSWNRAELFVNGKSAGIREKKHGSANCLERYRLMWENIAYEPGEIEVRALDDAGNVRAVQTIRTAGVPARLEVTADRPVYAADGDDLCYVTVKITDAEGNLCPKANTRLTFSVEGAGEFIASDNGCQTDLEPFGSCERDAFNGFAIGIFRTIKDFKGDMRICVSAEGMKNAYLCIPVR